MFYAEFIKVLSSFIKQMDEKFNNRYSSNSDKTTMAKPLSLATLTEKIKEINNIEANTAKSSR
jgi:hypothetical protein